MLYCYILCRENVICYIGYILCRENVICYIGYMLCRENVICYIVIYCVVRML